MTKEWNELKEWIELEVKEYYNSRNIQGAYLLIVLNKMKQIENSKYVQSLTEAGY